MTLTARPRRILHVSQPSDAGVAVVVRHLAGDQIARGWQVAVACAPDGRLAHWVSQAGATVLPWSARREPGWQTAPEVVRLRRLAQRWAPDLVHLHSAKAGMAGRMAFRGRLPTVFQPHAWSFLAVTGPAAALAVRWERYASRWADAVAYVSEGERTTGVQAGIRARWVATPNGVDLASFPAADRAERTRARVALGLDPDAPLVVCVGRLCRQKGQDVLVEAWRTVTASEPDATLALVGDGPDEATLRRRVPPSVRLVGTTTEVHAWYAAADVVAQPSRWEAGASLTVLEALATGRSVVASEVPGAREVLDEATGALVPVGQPDVLADAIVLRLRDRLLADREGERGRGVVEARFSLATTNQGVADIYDEVLATRRL